MSEAAHTFQGRNQPTATDLLECQFHSNARAETMVINASLYAVRTHRPTCALCLRCTRCAADPHATCDLCAHCSRCHSER